MRRQYNIQDLHKYRFPNLMAEYMESGYSICTLGEHLGLGSHRQEDDPDVWGKLLGKTDLYVREMLALTSLFDCSADYLFSSELTLFEDVPLAYIRHLDLNQRQERDSEIYRLSVAVKEKMQEDPEFVDLIKSVLGEAVQAIKLHEAVVA